MIKKAYYALLLATVTFAQVHAISWREKTTADTVAHYGSRIFAAVPAVVVGAFAAYNAYRQSTGKTPVDFYDFENSYAKKILTPTQELTGSLMLEGKPKFLTKKWFYLLIFSTVWTLVVEYGVEKINEIIAEKGWDHWNALVVSKVPAWFQPIIKYFPECIEKTTLIVLGQAAAGAIIFKVAQQH